MHEKMYGRKSVILFTESNMEKVCTLCHTKWNRFLISFSVRFCTTQFSTEHSSSEIHRGLTSNLCMHSN